MTRVLSDHLSNPLQSTLSDAINNSYHRQYNKVAQYAFSSEDELGLWAEQGNYIEHVRSVVGSATVSQPGPSRSRNIPPERRFINLDDYLSDDELAQPFCEVTTIDPRKEFSSHKGQNSGKEVEYNEEGEQEHKEDHDELDGLEADSRQSDDDDELDDYGADFDEDEEMSDQDVDSAPPALLLSSPFSSPQSSRPPSPDESKTLLSRPKEEQAEIQQEISALYKAVPDLRDHYQLLDQLGTGTFSSVYKAIDVSYDDWDNRPWLGNHPPESSAFYQSAGPLYRGRGGRGTKQQLADSSGDVDMDPEVEPDVSRYQPKDGKVYVAIKRIYTTSGPERIKNELSILETCRGCRHTSQIITAFRRLDQVAIVLPYQRNMDFRDFYQTLHPEGLKCYFRCLLRALRDIHSRGIIHRDVKPANFLFDPFTGIGTLCDFGLASRMDQEGPLGQCLHTPSSDEFPHGKNRTIDENKRVQVKMAQKDARAKSSMPPDKVGYPENDRRPISKANRAGTRGFRAPEVLLKCQAQTGAVDVWSAAVILLSFLTGKFPIFQSNDDVEALMEIAVVLGRRNTERAATLHGRTFATNVPDLHLERTTWREFAERLNPDIMTPRKYDMRYYPHNSKHRDGRGPSTTMTLIPDHTHDMDHGPSDQRPVDIVIASKLSDRYLNPPSVERHTRDMRNALDLLESMLHFESTKRITPRDALYHPFLSEPGMNPHTEGDDMFAPHRLGEGVCSALHTRDDVTEQMYVEVLRKVEGVLEIDGDGVELSNLSGGDVEIVVDKEGQRWAKDYQLCISGQGIAIGNRPCAFHRGSVYGFELEVS